MYISTLPKPHIPSHLPQPSMQSTHGLIIVPPPAQTFMAGQPSSAVPLNSAVVPNYVAPPYSATPISAAPLNCVVPPNSASLYHGALTSEPLSVIFVSPQLL